MSSALMMIIDDAQHVIQMNAQGQNDPEVTVEVFRLLEDIDPVVERVIR